MKTSPAANWESIRVVPPGTPQPTFFVAKSRGIYVLLALLLGGLGIHNFYAGRIGSGIAQLLITLFLGWLIIPLLAVWFWTIVEAIVIDTDGQNRKFA